MTPSDLSAVGYVIHKEEVTLGTDSDEMQVQHMQTTSNTATTDARLLRTSTNMDKEKPGNTKRTKHTIRRPKLCPRRKQSPASKFILEAIPTPLLRQKPVKPTVAMHSTRKQRQLRVWALDNGQPEPLTCRAMTGLVRHPAVKRSREV